MTELASDPGPDSAASDPTTIRRLYGRRQGHALRQGQAALFAELLPRLAVPESGTITAASLFGDSRPLWLEIGFGKGEHMARVLKVGGEFRFGTDHPVYCRWALMQMQRRSEFAWIGEMAEDFLCRPSDWPQTRYEAKARRLGHEIWYFRWQRV